MNYLKYLALYIGFLILFGAPFSTESAQVDPPGNITSVAAYHRSLPRLTQMLDRTSLQLDAPLFIRIFKQTNELEIWLQTKRGRFEHFKTYII